MGIQKVPCHSEHSLGFQHHSGFFKIEPGVGAGKVQPLFDIGRFPVEVPGTF
jgi:hypothetical protein